MVAPTNLKPRPARSLLMTSLAAIARRLCERGIGLPAVNPQM